MKEKNAIINEGAVTDDNDTIGGDNEEIRERTLAADIVDFDVLGL